MPAPDDSQLGSFLRDRRTKLDPAAVSQYVTAGRSLGAVDFLLGIIPTSIVDAMARSDILQVLLFSVVFGLALNAIGGRGRQLQQGLPRLPSRMRQVPLASRMQDQSRSPARSSCPLLALSGHP